jgi:transposase
LQRLAAETIGTHDAVRQRGLVLEQQQLIGELRLLQAHLAELDREIVQVVAHTREGTILLSIPEIGPIQAAAILAAVGNIRNFSRAAQLKAYFGWAPKREQSQSSVRPRQSSWSISPVIPGPSRCSTGLVAKNVPRRRGDIAAHENGLDCLP